MSNVPKTSNINLTHDQLIIKSIKNYAFNGLMDGNFKYIKSVFLLLTINHCFYLTSACESKWVNKLNDHSKEFSNIAFQ